MASISFDYICNEGLRLHRCLNIRSSSEEISEAFTDYLKWEKNVKKYVASYADIYDQIFIICDEKYKILDDVVIYGSLFSSLMGRDIDRVSSLVGKASQSAIEITELLIKNRSILSRATMKLFIKPDGELFSGANNDKKYILKNGKLPYRLLKALKNEYTPTNHLEDTLCTNRKLLQKAIKSLNTRSQRNLKLPRLLIVAKQGHGYRIDPFYRIQIKK
ncbi:MAG: hypothetical protein WCV79_02305 [Candidatus Paceibacterota bacterium]|jgi:hypothetical protein